MPTPGYNSTVKVTGTPTAMVGEATTDAGAHTTYQITNAAKRILDPDAAITVKKNGVAQAATLYTLDKLFGRVTFLAALLGGDVVTIDGNYLPTLDVIECKEASVSNQRDLADTTVFKASPAKTKMALLKSASGSIHHLKALLDDLDAGAGTVRLYDLMANGTRKVLELGFGSSGYVWRGWVLFESQEVSAAFDDLVNASLSWQSTLDDSQSSVGNSAFGFGIP
jgi:hypothetical protein